MLESSQFVVKSILHARPVAALLKVAKECGCEPFVKNDEKWEAAGIINLLMMGAKEGRVLELGVEGGDAKACLKRWATLFDEDFPTSLDNGGSSEES